MSWSDTGPILVTKMSVLTSVTRSVEARNEDFECQSELVISLNNPLIQMFILPFFDRIEVQQTLHTQTP